MALYDLKKLLSENSYPGRGIIVGKSEDGKKALIAYFIMGRSENSRNRIFERFDRGLRTRAFDESKVKDPSLIIYDAYLEVRGNNMMADIVTNGDQTTTLFDEINANRAPFSFEIALQRRCFEPDAPNFTPRISAVAYYDEKKADFEYKMSILKSADEKGEKCQRFFFNYPALSGKGHFIHTYKCDGNPIPSFLGEPEEIALPNSARELADIIWQNLDADNKVSLFVKEVDLETRKSDEVIINKNK